ncbi:MAG: bifunctional hydroxymethylpyrimidine kinase/phosphomethylpyrimidine kinase [Candidatus Promineifilaceae bacterium]|nr:bifunctional hydroxymethylpyrimidine kinase/phosphomethylpyrimidine kinase [Candidatus Promineifilaceae bacterium]
MAGEPAKVLTIAGSDSGGAAGLQADLKTFTALGVYGMSVVTTVTAQNSVRVEGVHSLPAAFVSQQIDAVLSDYGAAAVKTGFIGRAELVETIAERLSIYAAEHPTGREPFLVVDPVLVNHRGESMFPTNVTRAYRKYLLPMAHLVTPNRREAERLTERTVETVAEMEAAARLLHRVSGRSVLVKGGREEGQVVDVFFDGEEAVSLVAPHLESANTHGSGDTLSAAIVAFLALGESAPNAVRRARAFTHAAIRAAAGWQMGGGHGPLNHLLGDW